MNIEKLAGKIAMLVIVTVFLCSCGITNKYVSVKTPTTDLPSNYSKALARDITIYVEDFEDWRRVAQVDPKIISHKGYGAYKSSALFINDKEVTKLIDNAVRDICEKMGYKYTTSPYADLSLSGKLLELEYSGISVGGGWAGVHIICSLTAVVKIKNSETDIMWNEIIKAYGVKKHAQTYLWTAMGPAFNSAMEDLMNKIAATIYEYQTEYYEKRLKKPEKK